MPRDREPRANRDKYERNDDAGKPDRAARDARQRDPILAQRIEGEVRSGGEPDQRDGAVADEPKGVDFLAPHKAQPRGPNGETDQQVARESRQPRALREFAADDRGEQQKSERQGRARFERPARSHAMKDGHHQAQHEQRRDRPYGAHGPQNIRRRHAFDNALERGYLPSSRMAFVHLHTHSEYSLLDGANRIPELLDRVQALGMDSVAITDHGNLHGAWQFYSEARARKVRPILGFEAYLAFGDRHKRERPPPEAPGAYSHLVLLARNRTGYQNLVKLSSIGFLEGFYRRPRIDRQVLEQYSDGLIGLAACLSGGIALYLRQGDYEAAKASAQYFAGVFGPDGFWLEVQDHGLADEKTVTAGMFRLAQELGLPVVTTNDAHYLRKEDAEAHDVLLAIGTGKDLDDPNRFRFFGQESYVKSEREMRALFPGHPEVVGETQRVADLCEFDFEKRYFLPQYPRPAEFASDNDLLVHLARVGAAARYGDPLPQAVHERLVYQLRVISHTGYAGYFLIVYDMVKAAKDRGIPVGPGRGSAAGSLVAYALGITDIDPLKFDLLFQPVLNPERISMPDIDLDFCFERRGEVIEYMRSRYGRESVGQIITFGTMKARAAFRDVARTLRLEMGDVDRLSKLIPSGPGYALTLAEAAEKVPDLRAAAGQDERVRKILELGTRIEGLARHASVHAAGVVIAPGPLSDYVPVCLAPQEADAIITQFDMVGLEQVGMLKIDILGLKTLTVVHDTMAMVA